MMASSLFLEMHREFCMSDDPEIVARRHHILAVLLEDWPQTRKRVIAERIEKAREKPSEPWELIHVRAIIRRQFAHRQFALSSDEDARIESCTDLATLWRWLDRACYAFSVSIALM